MKSNVLLEAARQAIVVVGEGRGFVVDEQNPRLVITAAHCLPYLPPAAPFDVDNRSFYTNILAPLGGIPSISATSLFVDPIADLAVLFEGDEPDERFCSFIDSCHGLRIAAPPPSDAAWLLTLSGQWEQCRVSTEYGRHLTVIDANDGIAGGTSGSPILTASGHAIGLVSTGTPGAREHPRQPALVNALPAWLVRVLLNEE
jgi:hypothetical protein